MKWGLQRKEHSPYSQTWWRFIGVLWLLCCFWLRMTWLCAWKPEDYQRILEWNVGPSVRKLGLRQRSWVFQQDNDPKHTSKSTQKWFKTKRWRVLKWPAMSPDLNPIKHLWRDLKTAVGRRHPSNLRHLEQLAKEEWSKIPVERCKKLIDGYRKRLISVVLPNINFRVPIILSSPFLGFCVEWYQIWLFFLSFFVFFQCKQNE